MPVLKDESSNQFHVRYTPIHVIYCVGSYSPTERESWWVVQRKCGTNRRPAWHEAIRACYCGRGGGLICTTVYSSNACYRVNFKISRRCLVLLNRLLLEAMLAKLPYISYICRKTIAMHR